VRVAAQDEYWRKHTWERLRRDVTAAAAKLQAAARGKQPAIDDDE
jgi:hypothetical protein